MSTLVTNMMKYHDGSVLSKKYKWEYEYSRGVTFNIYFQTISPHWSRSRVTFRQLTEKFYKWKPNILIIGIIKRTRKDSVIKSQILLTPFDYVIREEDIAIILTDEMSESLKVAREPSELYATEPNIPKDFFGDNVSASKGFIFIQICRLLDTYKKK